LRFTGLEAQQGHCRGSVDGLGGPAPDRVEQEKENVVMGKKEKKEKKEKPLDRMTAKELRAIALEIPEMTGVHGMNKAELLAGIKGARGIVDQDKGAKKSDISVREIKKKIHNLKALKVQALESKEKAKADILRRRISRLKKRTRRAA
jgi:hypothetical protein